MMHPGSSFRSATELNYEQWRDMLRPDWGLYTPDDPKNFAGRVRARSIYGFNASDISNNCRRCDRTQRDVRLDGVDHYYAVFQTAGRSTIVQNDQAIRLAVGEVTLLDSARPLTYVNEGYAEWVSLQLPRQAFVSHVGVEPVVGSRGYPGIRIGRLLHQLILDATEDGTSIAAPTRAYMQLAVYDLLGALFAPSDPAPHSVYTDKLFARMCAIINDRFADPDFGQSYLHKLFAAWGVTCNRLIRSVRLNHAACLLRRRSSLNTSRSISDIAYACGFSDYRHFSREFHRRFGHAPSANIEDQ